MQSSVVIILSNLVKVTCRFLSGSLCKGCYLQFVGQKLNHSIARMEGQDFAMEEFHADINTKTIVVLVYDLEEDGSIGSLSISADIHVNDFVHTVNSMEGLSPESGNSK